MGSEMCIRDRYFQHFSLTSKKFIVCVFPGVEEVRAISVLAKSMLIRDDLPTFDLPMNAYSGSAEVGHCASVSKLPKNSIFLITISNLLKTGLRHDNI